MFFILTTICSISVVTTAIMMCLCWRKKNEKNDLLGLEGLVTQKNPDENVNHLPSAAIQTVPDGIKVTSPDDIAIDALKRPVIVSNPRRSLPDIPFDGGLGNYGDGVTYEPSGDNTSDLYATVEHYQNSSVKRHTLPNGIESRPSVSQHSSLSQADDTFSPYARVKEHPYDKLCETEHPYAQVQPSSSLEQEDNSCMEGTSRTSGARNERATLQTIGESTSNSRSRRSSNQSVIVALDIPAASAVAGGIAASQELPYMTPPIAQTNFSGDSQDSSRGYTSISVREPLADIRAQTKLLNRRDLDPHYSTVSDDSDDVYTTIQDPNQTVYTSGSETYAQIQPPPPPVEVEINMIGESIHIRNSDERENDCLPYEHTSQLPSVSSLKQVTNTHSRQASSSSSVGIVGSPKPEKRQANSPLPPPPPTFPNFDLLTVNTVKLPVCKNLDEMYAKVQKSRKKSDKDIEEKVQNKPESSSNNDHNYETLRKMPGYHSTLKLPSEPGYDTINGPDSLLSSDPGYEILKHHSVVAAAMDPNYEELQQIASNVNDSVINNNCDMNNRYSVVNKVKNNTSDDVKSKTSSNNDSETKELSSTDEPNYESMTSESFSEHSYSRLKSTDSEPDPNYESVSNNEPNYESVKYLDVSYDHLEEENVIPNECKSSGSNQCNNPDPGYETIKGETSNKPNLNTNNELKTNCEEIVQV